jgi:hypothetical protein
MDRAPLIHQPRASRSNVLWIELFSPIFVAFALVRRLPINLTVLWQTIYPDLIDWMGVQLGA